MEWYKKTAEYSLKQLDSSLEGLSSADVKQRLVKYGPNQITVKTTPIWRKIVEPFANVFIGVLVLAAALSLLTGHSVDAIIIGAIIVVSAVIYYVQQYSTDRVLRALKRRDEQEVSTLRNGKTVKLSVEKLVPGDIVMLAEGEKVPADIRTLKLENVSADEAMLTGESLPIEKEVAMLQGDKPVYERINMLFQGSFIVSGRATGLVVATGSQTEFGKLADLSAPGHERSPAQKKIDDLIQKLIIGIGILTVIVLALELWRGIEIFEALRFVMALAVSAVPEGLPVAITVVMVLGMRRMAKYKALARSMKAVETIGIVTTIASDKTGTLTKNKLEVQEIWQPAEREDFADYLRRTINDSQPGTADPLDAAMQSYANGRVGKLPRGIKLAQSLSFDQDLAMSGMVWQIGDSYQTLIKGAPEAIIRRSYKSGMAERRQVEKQLEEFASQGYRVIAVARIKQHKQAFDDLELVAKQDFEFLGLVAIADQLRPEAKRAIKDAQSAGITVRMITGDHAETAYSIGKQLGLVDKRQQVMDCRVIDKKTDRQLKKELADIRVFARVAPEAKHRILGILKQTDITAMTGDGVNDVPALSNAHVGIAMGSGSQIAKEAGDIVLLDDNFASIVKAVEGGRVITDNIRRMMYHLLATSLAEVILMIGALVVGLPLPVVAVQILWVNLVTDTAFDIPLGLEPAEEDVMKRPPRGVKQPILDGALLWRFVIISLTIAVVTLVTFWTFLASHGVDYARTIAFTVLVVTQWANAVNARSELSSLFVRMRVVSWPFVAGFVIAFVLQLIVLFGPLAGPLHVVPVDLGDLLASAAISFAIVLLVAEVHKAYCRFRQSKLVRETR